jgi:hypothetical protein
MTYVRENPKAVRSLLLLGFPAASRGERVDRFRTAASLADTLRPVDARAMLAAG